MDGQVIFIDTRQGSGAVARHYVLTDPLGNTAAVLDPNGTGGWFLKERFTYTPTGESVHRWPDYVRSGSTGSWSGVDVLYRGRASQGPSLQTDGRLVYSSFTGSLVRGNGEPASYTMAIVKMVAGGVIIVGGALLLNPEVSLFGAGLFATGLSEYSLEAQRVGYHGSMVIEDETAARIVGAAGNVAMAFSAARLLARPAGWLYKAAPEFFWGLTAVAGADVGYRGFQYYKNFSRLHWVDQVGFPLTLAAALYGGYTSRGAFLAGARAGAAWRAGQAAPNGLRGPVVFRQPRSGATAAEMEQIEAYVAGCNDALEAGALSPTGRVSTSGALRELASEAARVERARAAALGDPYLGQVSHVPDTTWTGTARPYAWLDLTQRINTSLGAQAAMYPLGYQPTVFVLGTLSSGTHSSVYGAAWSLMWAGITSSAQFTPRGAE